MKWITDRTPINEHPILILTKRRYRGEDRYEIVRGFYTDGNTNSEDSDYCWLDTDNWEYDEENDAYIIPQGYWEERWYGNEENSVAVIDDKVVGWCRMKDALDEAIKQVDEIAEQLKEQMQSRIIPQCDTDFNPEMAAGDRNEEIKRISNQNAKIANVSEELKMRQRQFFI